MLLNKTHKVRRQYINHTWGVLNKVKLSIKLNKYIRLYYIKIDTYADCSAHWRRNLQNTIKHKPPHTLVYNPCPISTKINTRGSLQVECFQTKVCRCFCPAIKWITNLILVKVCRHPARDVLGFSHTRQFIHAAPVVRLLTRAAWQSILKNTVYI